MICRRDTYRMRPEQVAPFTAFFEERVLPVQFKHGARLGGWWVSEAEDEITLVWEYPDRAVYARIQAAVEADEAYVVPPAGLFASRREEWLTPRTGFVLPKVVAAACACITNDRGEVLLVHVNYRSDTWEMPGGVVDANEPLHAAVIREVREETGIEVELDGVTGVYHHAGRTVVVCFRGRAVGGELRTSKETGEVGFFAPAEALARTTRQTLRPRLEDAMAGRSVPYEAILARPYQLLYRTGV